jgi:hypothetical protein
VLALTELLISPISWSHHWSWLVVAPIVIVQLWTVHRAVATALVVLVALGVTAPYLWLQVVPLSYLGSNALVLGGAVVLVMWAVAEDVLRPGSTGRPHSATGPAPQSLHDAVAGRVRQRRTREDRTGPECGPQDGPEQPGPSG